MRSTIHRTSRRTHLAIAAFISHCPTKHNMGSVILICNYQLAAKYTNIARKKTYHGKLLAQCRSLFAKQQYLRALQKMTLLTRQSSQNPRSLGSLLV